MRAQHTAHSLPSFPIFASAFLSHDELVLGGGGGASRTGIKNKLRLYNVGADRSLDLIDELELAKDEDAPMSMAAHTESKTLICGINSSAEKLEKGQNENCRVYDIKDRKLKFVGSHGTLNTGDVDDYQKVTLLSPDGKLLAVAGSHSLSLLSYPSLVPVASEITTEKSEIYDASFSRTTLVIATTINLLVYGLPDESTSSRPSSPTTSRRRSRKSTSLPQLELLRTVGLPSSLGGATGSSFRAVRYHPRNDKILYTVTNTIPGRTRAKKASPRQAFVCKWSTETWTVSNIRKVGSGGSTCFDVSPDGRLLGFGTSHYTIGLLDAVSLSPVVTILKAHEFPPTTLKFNPTSKLLVSGSADNSIRIVSVPDFVGSSSWGLLYVIILTLLFALFALAAQRFLSQ